MYVVNNIPKRYEAKLDTDNHRRITDKRVAETSKGFIYAILALGNTKRIIMRKFFWSWTRVALCLGRESYQNAAKNAHSGSRTKLWK